jgi:hypothetical protein
MQVLRQFVLNLSKLSEVEIATLHRIDRAILLGH